MAQLRRDYEAFLDRDAEVLVVLPEDAREVADFWTKQEMPMPGLADPGHKVADLYRQQVNLLRLGRMPALFVVDRHGVVRRQHYGNSMRDIPENQTILALLDALNLESAGHVAPPSEGQTAQAA